ncbi:hypothetical protein TSAR_015701 [Trichomalopsis sarcophagae]|uniref:C3H1-type domain-containing protein n=1 Tax=Trichomalopsis sarcophagae TaxID=543379 RepID=A0A232F4M6_9HYME|nr:hypothetical protein TSAR_015701 [Trichomalopsis sarcophagae]
MSQLDDVLQKQQQLTERSAIKPAHHPQFTVEEHNRHRFNMPQNSHRMTNPPLYNRFYPAPIVSSKVFFNPDFPRQPQNSVIHVNPAAKANIHFNPNRLIQAKTSHQDLRQIPSRFNPNTYNHHLIPRNVPSKVHVNPAILNQPRIPIDNPCSNIPMTQNETSSNWHFNRAVLNQQTMPNSVPIHINPKFVAKPLVSEIHGKSKNSQQNEVTSKIFSVQNTIANSGPSCSTGYTNNFTNSSSHSNLTSTVASVTENPVISSTPVSIKKSPNSNIYKKSPNSSLVSLSKRKLIRVKRNTRPTASIANPINSSPLKRRLSSSGLKKIKISPKNKNRLIKVSNMKLVRTTDVHWYKQVYKIVPKSTYKKNVLINNVRNDPKMALVDIGGVMFKKTRNKIVRSSSNNAAIVKRQRVSTLNRSGQFVSSKGGKTLHKVDCATRKLNTSTKIDVSTITSISSVKTYKSNASNKVKQRSLQILRNKMRKNNQPCLLFQKYGYCNSQLKGTCPKVHDKKQVAVCKNFLQGKCLLNNCLLSHDVGPEKMPTCKFFLQGCCTREGCPYLHVKVPSKNPICVEFLRGYCPQGNECMNRHINACPEFDKTGACSKGKSCPYPHEPHLTKTKKRRKSVTSAKSMENLLPTSEVVKTGTRYYDNINTDLNPACDHDTEDLSDKRVRLLKKIKIMKQAHDSCQENESSTDCNVDNQSKDSECEEEHVIVCNRRKPMGPAESFIPVT